MLLFISGFGFLACMPQEGPVARDMENDRAKRVFAWEDADQVGNKLVLARVGVSESRQAKLGKAPGAD
jgi:hypothetical protein